MNYRKLMHVLFALAISTTVPSCRKATPIEASHVVHAGAAHEESTEAKVTSDLDRSLDDLVAMTCEHKKKTFECDKCRYQIGFVRAPASLAQGGLLKMAKVGRQPSSSGGMNSVPMRGMNARDATSTAPDMPSVTPGRYTARPRSRT